MCLQEECISACGRAVCKHLREYLDARPDWTEGLLQPALSYLGAVPVPVLALVTGNRVSCTACAGSCHGQQGELQSLRERGTVRQAFAPQHAPRLTACQTPGAIFDKQAMLSPAPV